MPYILPAAVLLSCAALAGAQNLELTYSPTGALNKLGYFEAQTCDLVPTLPSHVTKTPAGTTDVLYGTIRLGPRENRGKFTVMLSNASTNNATLYVDSNGDGDLTNDAAPEWRREQYSGPPEPITLNRQIGTASLQIPYEGGPREGNINFYRMDPNDPKRAKTKTQFFYYRDYGYSGTLTLGKYTYQAFLSDDRTLGDFRGLQLPSPTAVTLFIDVGGNKRFDRRSEAFDVKKPIVIGEQTVEVQNLTSRGDKITVALTKNKVEIKPPEKEPVKEPVKEPSKGPSKEPVKEPSRDPNAKTPEKTPTPGKPGAAPGKPDLSIGATAPTFTGTDLDGNSVTFPDDYKGKVVLIDFWATWCKPCRDEIPNVVAAYESWHDQGLEVLGVSLDQANKQDALKKFIGDNKMPWKQIYDGKYWSAAVAQTYDVHSIPAMFLIDGDTGKILASGGMLRGAKLKPQIEKVLKAKNVK